MSMSCRLAYFFMVASFILGSVALLAALCQASPDEASGPGVSGASPGSAGMEDSDEIYLAERDMAARQGKTSQRYIGSLVSLGMHYNRQNQFKKAAGALTEALTIIDRGALKPLAANLKKPERVVEKPGKNGTVQAEVIRTAMPYEETLQDLLPQLVSAEIACNALNPAETHIKRLIALGGTNEVTAKLNLISAYHLYAELLRKQHRLKEASDYERKADQINSTFKPL